jgi:hypothetical protein
MGSLIGADAGISLSHAAGFDTRDPLRAPDRVAGIRAWRGEIIGTLVLGDAWGRVWPKKIDPSQSEVHPAPWTALSPGDVDSATGCYPTLSTGAYERGILRIRKG